MSLPQQKFRELVFQLLYSRDIGKPNDEDIIPLLMKELSIPKKTVKEGLARMEQIIDKKEIDSLITQTSASYAFERIQTVERNILRLGVFELLYDDNIPPKVAIAEALRLSKKFSTVESSTFVNAVLDSIYKKSVGEKEDVETLKKAAADLKVSEEVAHDASLQKPQEENEA